MFLKICRVGLLLWTASLVGSGFTLGQYAQGGVIFFLTPDKGHGLVVAITDQDGGMGIPWGDDSAVTHANLDGIFFGPNYTATAGSINTGQSIAALGEIAAAATACHNYSATVDGVVYHDWFLPSYNELTLMYMFASFINQACSDHGGTPLETDYYWSSLESSKTTAKNIFFGDTTTPGMDADKTTLCRVRAIRAF